MFQSIYQRYKPAIWLVLALLFASGAITNYFTGTTFEIFLNGGFAVFSFLVFVKALPMKHRKQ
ncbi:hypothetical protein [Domibacillus indicus]|uniref:hypothetical protein n=1 Tax=Domibacillus indicus TaxID=1437523 RepID=UPI00061810CD|nr:hypothetical protein [Domibacillus indicus]